ncbi:MAG: beta-N-acetylhexosaminidase [Treponema sp.]|jgi:beta-N-acetylhexosaminidase|nr:beta-N-acetylhexosaminidase [Treponema sp.]
MTITQKIGQRFTAGLNGLEITAELRRLVREYQVGNVILFRENLQSRSQAHELCAAIQELVQEETGLPAFISLDQEGGVVTRLPPDMVNVPGAMALAATGDTQAVYAAARITIQELRSIGVNLNLAPVLDINSQADNPVIGVRSFGADPQRVSEFAGAAIRAYRDEGFLCCGKHFPGHGDTSVDSHLALPRVDKTPAQLEACELASFRAAVEQGIPAIMSSHILFPQLEPLNLPATMSRTIITGLLKERMGFSGLVLSDAMEMNAIKEFYGVGQGCVESLAAGVDMVFVCHDPAQMETSLKAIATAYDTGRFDAAEFDASVEKIRRYKAQYAPVPPAGGAADPAANPARENAALMRRTIARISAAGVTGAPWTAPPLGDNPFFAGCLPYRSTNAANKADTTLSFAPWFAQRFGGRWVENSLNPGEEEIAAIAAQASGASALILGTVNGHLYHGQLALAQALSAVAAEGNIPLIAVALRNPYDLAAVPATALRLAAWEYSPNSFAALEAVFRGEWSPMSGTV